MQIQETKGRFGYHLSATKDELHPTEPFVQFYVKSSALSRAADLAISQHFTTAAEIDRFVDDAIADLKATGDAAKGALARTQAGNE